MIQSSAVEEPEFCHPACNEYDPCRLKVCPYRGANHKRERPEFWNVLPCNKDHSCFAKVLSFLSLGRHQGVTGANGFLFASDKSFFGGVLIGIVLAFVLPTLYYLFYGVHERCYNDD